MLSDQEKQFTAAIASGVKSMMCLFCFGVEFRHSGMRMEASVFVFEKPLTHTDNGHQDRGNSTGWHSNSWDQLG